MIIAFIAYMHIKPLKTTSNWQPPFKGLQHHWLCLTHYCKTSINKALPQVLCLTLLGAYAHSTSSAVNTVDNSVAINPTFMTVSEVQQQTIDFANQYFFEMYGKKSSDGQDTGSRFEINSARLDPRLKLARCPQALEFEPQKNNVRSGRTLIKVRCNGSKPWAVFVPLNIQLWKTVLVASQPLRRGDIINSADVSLRETKLNNSAHHYLTLPTHAIGQMLTRDIAQNAVLTRNHLTQPKLIKRGDEVLIVANTQSVSVRMLGTALADGKKGEQISVRNLRSDRIIKARVIERGKVQVGS